MGRRTPAGLEVKPDGGALAGVAAAAADDTLLRQAVIEDAHRQLPGAALSGAPGVERLVTALLDTGPAEAAGAKREIDTGEASRASAQDAFGAGADARVATLAKLDEAGFRFRPGRANELAATAKIAAKELVSVDGSCHCPPLTEAQSFTCHRVRL